MYFGGRGVSVVRVLIADDHPLFRDGMHGLLDSVGGTEVVDEAATGDHEGPKGGRGSHRSRP